MRILISIFLLVHGAWATENSAYLFDWSNTSNGRLRRIEVRCSLRHCSRAVLANTSDAPVHSWRVGYFTELISGAAGPAGKLCAADQITAETAQAFIEQIAGLAANLQSPSHGD